MKYRLKKLDCDEKMPEIIKTTPKKGKKLFAFPDNYIVLDIETTGLNPTSNEIIELSALKVENGEITQEYTKLVKPYGYLPYFITKLTGINKEMLEDAPRIKEAVIDFKNFCSDSIVLGHNVTFDLNFIGAKLEKYHNLPFDNDYIDTLTIARKLLPGLKNRKLSTIAEHFNFNTGGMHRGLKDCQVTNLCYCKFKELIIEQHGSLNNFK